MGEEFTKYTSSFEPEVSRLLLLCNRLGIDTSSTYLGSNKLEAMDKLWVMVGKSLAQKQSELADWMIIGNEPADRDSRFQRNTKLQPSDAVLANLVNRVRAKQRFKSNHAAIS